jgi:methyltransferase (TIGR00027 family)
VNATRTDSAAAGKTQSLVANVSDTARWAAANRASESAREDALFHDPFAAWLAGERGAAIAAKAPWLTRNGWPVAARTKAIDDLIAGSLAEGCDRVLCLAAGLDARPYRLELPESLVWIEADLPALVEEKNAALAHETPRCRVTRQAVDLADPAARAAFLDDALAGAKRALVVTEGLLMYLTQEVVLSVAKDLARSSVRYWIFDILSPAIRETMTGETRMGMANAPFLFAPSDGVAYFEAIGWRAKDIRSIFDEAHRLGRLPWLLHILGSLPLPRPDPRRPARAAWSAVVRLCQ